MKMDLALNNLKGWYAIKPNQQSTSSTSTTTVTNCEFFTVAIPDGHSQSQSCY